MVSLSNPRPSASWSACRLLCVKSCRQLFGESAESSFEMYGTTLGVIKSKLAGEREVLYKDQGVFKVI